MHRRRLTGLNEQGALAQKPRQSGGPHTRPAHAGKPKAVFFHVVDDAGQGGVVDTDGADLKTLGGGLRGVSVGRAHRRRKSKSRFVGARTGLLPIAIVLLVLVFPIVPTVLVLYLINIYDPTRRYAICYAVLGL